MPTDIFLHIPSRKSEPLNFQSFKNEVEQEFFEELNSVKCSFESDKNYLLGLCKDLQDKIENAKIKELSFTDDLQLKISSLYKVLQEKIQNIEKNLLLELKCHKDYIATLENRIKEQTFLLETSIENKSKNLELKFESSVKHLISTLTPALTFWEKIKLIFKRFFKKV